LNERGSSPLYFEEKYFLFHKIFAVFLRRNWQGGVPNWKQRICDFIKH
jgi:hypothetical protein